MANVKPPVVTAISAPPKKEKTKVTEEPKKARVVKKSTQSPITKPSPEDVVNIQFKVPSPLRKEIKAYCVDNDKSMTALFLEMYKEYRAKHG